MLDVLVFDLQEVLGALLQVNSKSFNIFQKIKKKRKTHLHELTRVLKVLERHHLDPEELHAHQQGDDGLGRVRRGFFGSEKNTMFWFIIHTGKSRV